MNSSAAFAQRLVRRVVFQDACLVLLIFLGGAFLGSRYIGAFQKIGSGEFGQHEFGAAVALACGRGFVDPKWPTPALTAFLERKTDSVSCSELPPGMAGAPLNFTQGLYRYLMTAVALQWKWSGVSWSRLTPLFGIAFGLTLCVAYGIFRLAGGPLVALAGVMPLAVSAHHLVMLPELRDYAKAPFILGLILLMARLAMPPYSRRAALALSGLSGLVLGVGFGFRNDILINVPPLVVVIALLLPVAWNRELRLKAACLALATAMFVASAWPILRAYQSGSNTGHVAVLGLMSQFDGPMGLTRPPYDVGTHYDDGFAAAVISARSYMRTGRTVAFLSPEYDREAVAFTLHVARHWPADIFVRGLASALTVWEFPFSVSGRFSPPVPRGVTGTLAVTFYEMHDVVLRLLLGLGPLLVAGAVIAIGSRSVRNGIALILLVLYYCGYPAVQFHIRHYFHLEFVAWWALVFLTAGCAGVVVRRVRREPLRDPRRRITGALATAAAIAATVAAPLWILRVYQQSHVPAMLEELERQPVTQLALSRAADGDHVSVVLNGLWNGPKDSDPVTVKYLSAEFSAARCPAENVPVLLKYETGSVLSDFSTLLRVVVDRRGSTYQFAPVFFGRTAHFVEMRMPAGYDSCLRSVGVVNDAGRVTLPMDFMVTPGVREATWFQRLAQWENAPMSSDPAVHASLPNLATPGNPSSAAPPLHADYVAQGLMSKGQGWSGAATAFVVQSRLLQFPEQDIPAGAVLRATGVLRRGGVQIGIVHDGLWVEMQGVDTPGPFTVLVRAPRAGRYGALVSDYSTREWRLEPTSLLRRAVRYMAPWLISDVIDVHDIEWISRES